MLHLQQGEVQPTNRMSLGRRDAMRSPVEQPRPQIEIAITVYGEP